jgi:hypothetical protein
MADRAIFIGWNRPVVGREKQAMELWLKAMEYYGKLQADGKIESFEPVLLTAHGGDLNGFVFIKGDEEKLAKVRQEDTFIEYTMQAEYCLEGLGVIMGYVGEGAMDMFGRWSKLISS